MIDSHVRKKFSFGLQMVLEHRKHLEEAALHELALRRHAYDEAKLELDRIHEEIRCGQSEMPTGGSHFRAADLQLHDDHLQLLDCAKESQLGAVSELRHDFEAAREAAMVASRRRKVIETLRNRRQAAFLAAEMRFEQTELDDANLTNRNLRTPTECDIHAAAKPGHAVWGHRCAAGTRSRYGQPRGFAR